MAVSTPRSIPGVLLSSLMFEMKNSPGDMTGILLGETLRYSVSAISDAESSGTREERRICIQEYVRVENHLSFSDRRGRVDFNNLSKLVNGRLKNIVGWFRYRCNSSHQLSIMERTIHRHMMQGLPHTPGTDLVFGLFTEQTPEDPGLHTLEHSFHHWGDRSTQLVHVEIVNLKSTSTMPYRFSPIVPVPTSVEAYHDLFSLNRCGLLTDGGDNVHSLAAEELYKGLQLKFDPVQSDLKKSFNTITSLEADIESIRKQLKELNTTTEMDRVGTPSTPETKDKIATINSSCAGTTGSSAGTTMGTTNSDDMPPLISFNDESPPEPNHHGNPTIPSNGINLLSNAKEEEGDEDDDSISV